MRIRSGLTPAAICSSSVICWCVVLAGWMTSVLASPTLARCEISSRLSMKRLAGLAPTLDPEA